MPRPRLPLAIAGGAAVLAIGGFLVFQQFLAGDSVPALSLAPSAPGASAIAEPTVGAEGTFAPFSGTHQHGQRKRDHRT